MNDKLLQQAISMFDTPEKWEAFLELCYNKNAMCETWKWALINKLRHLFGISQHSDKWQFDNWVRIFPPHLKDQMEVRVNLGERRGYLWININLYNSVKARELVMKTPEIMTHLSDFEYYNDWDILNKPFSNKTCEPTYDLSCYKWGHETEYVANEIFQTYLQPFMTDEMADIFTHISNQTRK